MLIHRRTNRPQPASPAFARLAGIAPILAAVVLLLAARPAAAQSTTFINGRVAHNGVPAAQVRVELAGNNLRLTTATDRMGTFSFPALTAGHYTLSASKASLSGSATIDVGSEGATVDIALAEIKEIGAASVSARAAYRASGTTLALSGAQIGDSAVAGSFSDILARLPAAARGSNGQIHMNGDHGNVNYIIDGVPMPQALVRVLGDEFDPANVSYAEFIEGAYPAQYGDHFGLVANIGTRSAPGATGWTTDFEAGSFESAAGTFTYHVPVAGGGSVLFSSHLARTARGLDPPVPEALHNASSIATQFLRVSLPEHGNDSLNFDLNLSHASFQIPPDTGNGAPPSTDDNEFQNDAFATLQYRHAIGTHGALSFGPLYRQANIRDTNDLPNDRAAGAISAATDRTSRSYGWITDYALRSARHEIKAGISYRTDAIHKHYAISTISPPVNILDDSPNVAHAQSAYVQDSWQLGTRWLLDYGVRFDRFGLASSDFRTAFAQTSPRIKLTYRASQRAGVYAYFGRLFVPFSFENISGISAQFLNPASGTAFDLKPERDSLYEIGAHLPVGAYDLGLRFMHKHAANSIDDGQVGATNVHQDVNFAEGVVDIQSALLQRSLARGGNVFASITHSRAFNRGCGSSLLIDCGAFPEGFTQADHDQRWSATLGLLHVFEHGWYSVGGEYGSGLSCGAYDGCKVPPHVTLDASAGRSLGSRSNAELIVKNLLNDRFALTIDSSLQGTHYAAPRSIELRLRTGAP